MDKRNSKAVMIQGTSSGVGKSLVTLGLCRLFSRSGIRVAPFKSQNMSLNAAVTIDGCEIGRAQAEQARAAGLEPTSDMNPILLKPQDADSTEVIVKGESFGRANFDDLERLKPRLRTVISDSLDHLATQYDLVIIEGAGSPVEMNLKEQDIANMFVAKVAGNAPVILVGDIDKGGVFASITGTLSLLDSDERSLVGGLLINKFRGNTNLFKTGIEFLEAKTGKPVLGILPYLEKLNIAEEDTLGLVQRPGRRFEDNSSASIFINIVKLPHIANYDEFQPLEQEPGVVVRYVDDQSDILNCHLLILPGSKSTMSDLQWLRDSGIAAKVTERHREHLPILAVCGGCQILARKITDPAGIEGSEKEVPALGLLDFDIHFERPKITELSLVNLCSDDVGVIAGAGGSDWKGYEIHCGRFAFHSGSKKLFRITKRGARKCSEEFDGSYNNETIGTMIHGLFENDHFRHHVLKCLAKKFDIDRSGLEFVSSRKFREYDRVADWLENHLDVKSLLNL